MTKQYKRKQPTAKTQYLEKEQKELRHGRRGRSGVLIPTKQISGLDRSPRSFPYVTILAIETRDPIPGDNSI